MPSIVSIAYKPDGVESRPANRFARIAIDTAELLAGEGIAGDRKAGAKDRHLNVMARETLDGLQLDGCRTGPGEMGEQIVLAGIEVEQLAPGTRLRMGPEAVIEVVKTREPCGRFEHVQKITIKSAWGRLGVMCRVVAGGKICVGDGVKITGAGS